MFEEGAVLLIDKPYDWTSFDVVRRLRSLIKIQKIGHAGTLDPLATGLLIMCTGKYTKRINKYMAEEKEYTGTITLGACTPTFDLESRPEQFKDSSALTISQIRSAAALFTGKISQRPPNHSAIKKDGKRAYELARKGVDVQLAPREVTVSVFETALKDESDRAGFLQVDFRVVCSTGTYIRSLANDLGAVLECGGYLSALCRTRIGEFELKDAWSMDQAEQKINAILAQKG